MSELSRHARAEARKKVERLVRADPNQRVDASGYRPPDALDGDVQTGERPVSRRQFKRGGTVEGEHAKHHAGHAPRRSGGRLADELANTDVREANKERDGTKHVGGFAGGGVPTTRFQFQNGPSQLSKAAGLKRGGRAHKNIGGLLDEKLIPLKRGGHASAIDGGTRPTGGRLARAEGGEAYSPPMGHHVIDRHTGQVVGRFKNASAATNMVDRKDNAYGAYRYSRQPIYNEADWSAKHRDQYTRRKSGGEADRQARKSGGAAGKGKMNVNIIIGAGHDQAQPQVGAAPPMAGPPKGMPVPVPPPMPPQGMGMGMPPAGAPAMPPPGMPPLPRRSGGRTNHIAEEMAEAGGSGGGRGRLEKIRLYGEQ